MVTLGNELRAKYENVSNVLSLIDMCNNKDTDLMDIDPTSHCGVCIQELIQAAVRVENDLWTSIKEHVDIIYYG